MYTAIFVFVDLSRAGGTDNHRPCFSIAKLDDRHEAATVAFIGAMVAKYCSASFRLLSHIYK